MKYVSPLKVAALKCKQYNIYLEAIVVVLFLFDLILYAPSTIFQLYRDGSSLVEPVPLGLMNCFQDFTITCLWKSKTPDVWSNLALN